jgi:hypothetical protein
LFCLTVSEVTVHGGPEVTLNIMVRIVVEQRTHLMADRKQRETVRDQV